jgi:hypothetical protein
MLDKFPSIKVMTFMQGSIQDMLFREVETSKSIDTSMNVTAQEGYLRYRITCMA